MEPVETQDSDSKLEDQTKATTEEKKKTKIPKRVEQGKKLAEWNKANKQRTKLETQADVLPTKVETPLKQTPLQKTKAATKDYFL